MIERNSNKFDPMANVRKRMEETRIQLVRWIAEAEEFDALLTVFKAICEREDLDFDNITVKQLTTHLKEKLDRK